VLNKRFPVANALFCTIVSWETIHDTHVE
jgi:hypothetical protein